MSKPLRAFAIALLLGTAAVAVGTVSTTEVAYAAGVRPAVGNPLKAAIDLAGRGDGQGALAKVREAESVGGLSSEEQRMVAQTKEYITVKTGAGNANSPAGAKAKFAADYNAGRYRDVVGSDADALRKYGAFDSNSQLVVAQAYQMMGDYKTAIQLLKGLGDGDAVLSQLMNAAGKMGDTETERSVAKRMILKGESKYWPYLIIGTENTHGLSEKETLDVYRIRYLTGNMRSADDYLNLAEMALQFGYTAEAQKVVKDGIAKNVLTGDRVQRLQRLADAQAAKDQAGFDKAIAAAKNGSGDEMVRLGVDLSGWGRNDDAISLVKAGIAKGVTDKDEAQISLGVVLNAAGQKGAAERALGAVRDPKARAVADLWSVYVGSGK